MSTRRPRSHRAARIVGTALLGLAVVAGCTNRRATRGSSTTAGRPALSVTASGYAVPAPLPHAAPGTLIGSAAVPALATTLGAARTWRVLYHSTDLANHDIAVSGLVLTPAGTPPPGGWTVAAWAHGTTGLADQCAPSIASRLGNDPAAVQEVKALLAQRLAVVASDYPGLGTPGVHTYLVGRADATAVIDSVPAARALLPGQLSKSWFTIGHSEGGQTALFVAQTATRRLPNANFLGTIALAPASSLEVIIPFAEGTRDPVEQAYLVYALEGLSAIDASIDVGALLTPAARAVLPDTTSGCIDDITRALAAHPVDRMLAADASTVARLDAELGRNDDPDRAASAQPILVTQGTADRDVPEVATDGMVTRLCGLGDRVEYRRYANLDHEQLIGGSQDRIRAWIDARLAGTPPSDTCLTDR